MNGGGLYGGAGNLLTFVSFCNKNTGVRVICGVGYSPENMVHGTLILVNIQMTAKHDNDPE